MRVVQIVGASGEIGNGSAVVATAGTEGRIGVNTCLNQEGLIGRTCTGVGRRVLAAMSAVFFSIASSKLSRLAIAPIKSPVKRTPPTTANAIPACVKDWPLNMWSSLKIASPTKMGHGGR